MKSLKILVFFIVMVISTSCNVDEKTGKVTPSRVYDNPYKMSCVKVSTLMFRCSNDEVICYQFNGRSLQCL